MGSLVILGPGTLGLSLARHAASLGLPVRLVGKSLAHAQAALNALEKRKPGLPISAFGNLAEALEGASTLLEALPEDLRIKGKAWREIHGQAPEDLLCLTGSSALSLAELRLAAGGIRPIVGFHLFVPVHRHPIVELVQEASSTPSLRKKALDMAERLQLKVVPMPDQPGYAATRMGLIQGLEAMRLLESGVATASELDALMVEGYGHPCGPLELSDRIGLDLRLALADYLTKALGEARYTPPSLLSEMVNRGELGRKTGQGFYRWSKEGTRL